MLSATERILNTIHILLFNFSVYQTMIHVIKGSIALKYLVIDKFQCIVYVKISAFYCKIKLDIMVIIHKYEVL